MARNIGCVPFEVDPPQPNGRIEGTSIPTTNNLVQTFFHNTSHVCETVFFDEDEIPDTLIEGFEGYQLVLYQS